MLKQIGWCYGALVALVMAMTTVAATDPRGGASQPSRDGVAIDSPDSMDSRIVERRGGGWDLNGPELAGSTVEVKPQATDRVDVDLSRMGPGQPGSTVVEHRRGGWDGNGPDLTGSRVELMPQSIDSVGIELSHKKREHGEKREKHERRDKH